MLIQDIIVETGVTHSEASEFPGVTVWVTAAFNGS
jgi:hypothetical protein